MLKSWSSLSRKESLQMSPRTIEFAEDHRSSNAGAQLLAAEGHFCAIDLDDVVR